ncbi:hypothetical protein [Desulfoscipio geothermicus]|uniref:Uncharacterized protein n=1 Tax=Desulfoscipio geothermicus DSM 3669 TaxID=1121426 RepID=A0A1I6E3T5_9FIRM|nr:hypothetical protein [Desulfoscipio geothermicus]SFR12419.1 hypothetical protein SAMN05660706_12524 [Desulfoscipio geothermicus DSM 3669]
MKNNKGELSKSILIQLGRIFNTRAIFDPVKYEIVFYGTRDQFKKAITILEEKDIDYTVDWNHFYNKSAPYTVKLTVNELFLKKQRKRQT